MNNTISVDIALPVYNEARVLEENVRTLIYFLKKHFQYEWKITIVDNASTDQTIQKAKKLSEKYSKVHYIHLDKKGRGRSLRKAWTESVADIVCYIDIDLSTRLEAFPALINLLVEGSDVAVGSRLKKGAKVKRCLIREILSRGYNLFIKTILFTHFSDAQCGFKAVKKRIVKKVVPQVKSQEWFFDTELLVLAEKAGNKIQEIPVEWIEDPDSRVNILSAVVEDIKGVLRLRYWLCKESFTNFLKVIGLSWSRTPASRFLE